MTEHSWRTTDGLNAETASKFRRLLLVPPASWSKVGEVITGVTTQVVQQPAKRDVLERALPVS
jgi:hypothetical protein